MTGEGEDPPAGAGAGDVEREKPDPAARDLSLDDGIEREEVPDGRDDPGEEADGENNAYISIEEDFPAERRDVVRRSPTDESEDQPNRTIIAIGSGRGGAGKSLLAANVAVYLAQIGKRVVAVDADPGGGTLNHMLGTARPGRGFGSFLRGAADNLDQLAIDTPVAGVRLVAGEGMPFGSPAPKISGKRVLAALRSLTADTIVVDLGPADSPLCLDVWLGADTSILVTLTDPASIESTYRFLKSAFLRRLRGERGLDKLQSQLGRPLPAALDLYRAALEVGRSARDDEAQLSISTEATVFGRASAKPGRAPGRTPAVATALAEAMAGFRPRFVVTQTRSVGDTKLGPQIAMAARRRLGHGLDYLGHVEADETVAAAARRRRPVMAEFPEARICKNIERIVRRILSSESEKPLAVTPPRLEEEQTFYEILETEPGVSDEEIRRAYRSLKEIYVSSSPVVAGLYEDAELATLHDRANAAHDILFAPERRRLYDLSLPEADLARAVRRAARAPRIEPVSVPRPDTGVGTGGDADAEVTGATLRRVRESRGIELSEVAQRTKIGERHLRSIEEEKFDELPAPVYVRGFVTEMARLLRIDPVRAAEQYLRRFHQANGRAARTPTLKEV